MSGFNRIAGIYDALARLVFGTSIKQSQLCFLPQLKECNNILVLRGGTGWWLNELLHINSFAKIVFVDQSEKMIELARQKVKDDRIRFLCGSFEAMAEGESEKYDAVILYNFLDLFSEQTLVSVLTRIKGRMLPNAMWLITDFVNEKRWHHLFLKVMYLFFNLFTGLTTRSLPDWKGQLKSIELKQIQWRMFYGKFIHSYVYQ